jgi:3-methyladenine DNA glycosylase Mpg
MHLKISLPNGKVLIDLCNGSGKLTQAMGIKMVHLEKLKKYPWRFCIYDCPYVSKPIFRKRISKEI